ncbi:Protein RDR1 [Penicillium cataractarum]|uniref:Protein RDR1 n=1 Tax=Penicillium cataractarum TaxID=2100454 RepID=A0A9W9RR35_9EURO|nr:Protein RDR1 [Penicillium cataractarum]KAJ5364125.1 Protein RDR1 [Penicillium cataractarum]
MDTQLETPNSLKRKRALLACIPCRERKRKCDGREPCCTCTSWGYDCYYLARRPRSRKVRDPTPDAQPKAHSPPKSTSRPSITEPIEVEADRGGLVRRMEANSGAAFVRKLGLKIDPAKAPKLNLFSWNIGTRQPASPITSTSTLPIVEIAALDHMKAMALVYFDKVHPCYGFIDRGAFFERLDLRWKSPLLWDIYDSTLAGVAALGCLFSLRDATITEQHLIRTARAVLDMQHLSGPPSIDLLTGWTLRSIYLRMTDSPHSTWIASSTLMHLVEASGLHPESHSVLPPRVQCDPDIQRRLVGVAHHLNVWTSYDLGLSRVSFQKNDLPALPSPKPGDCTVEVLRLLPVSVSLDPGRTKDETDLTSTLSSLLEGTHTQPPSVMAQCNLVLCILRRIHTQNLDIPSELAAKVLRLLKKGLGCARGMVMDCSPWHQVANVPFHIICVLLVMDTRSSLAMLPEAMQTVELVASTYDTETMREAYRAACLLVMLHQQRRKDDLAVLGEALNVHQQESPLESPPQLDPNSEEYSWLGALVADLPGLQRVDLDQFLNADMIDTSLFDGSG